MSIMDEYGAILIYEKFRYLTIPSFIYKSPLFCRLFFITTLNSTTENGFLQYIFQFCIDYL